MQLTTPKVRQQQTLFKLDTVHTSQQASGQSTAKPALIKLMGKGNVRLHFYSQKVLKTDANVKQNLS